MITIRNERSTDIPARERLLDAAFGPARLAKTSQRLREDRLAADELSFSAVENGRLVGTARPGTSRSEPIVRRCCSARSPWRATPKARHRCKAHTARVA